MVALGLNNKEYAPRLAKKNLENIELTNIYVKRKGSLFKNSYSIFFLKYFFKKGQSLKIISGFNYAFCRLYTAIFEYVEDKKKKYSNFFFIFNMLRLNTDFFNINFFLF